MRFFLFHVCGHVCVISLPWCSAVGGASSGSPNSKTVEQIGSTDVKSRAALRGIMSEFDHLEEERQSGRGGGVSSASARRGSGGGEDEEDEEDLMDLLDA